MKAQALLHSSDLLLVLGTRLNMNFVNKLVDRAHERGIPIVCITLGDVHGSSRMAAHLNMAITPVLEELNVEVGNPR
eukprot:m.129423 g.129423  ORF g.129423 m.129423 type:complete len:77 (-) comp9460_c0_seq11:4333-4563(-)